MDGIERRTMDKVSWRLVPFLMVCYFIAYLDRVNVGFAGATMRQDLNLSAAAFGGAAGIFFIAYFIFEVPSNLLLERFGARKWIARIMLSWGILSGTMAFIPAIARATGLGNENTFYLLRVLLGVAEAGFFPGIIFYLTLWFPSVYRARIVGYFMAAIPLSTVIGAPISGVLLYLHGGMGLAGWQWMFIVEAVPSIILAVVVFFYLTDRPADAHWLAPDERAWLSERLEIEQRGVKFVEPDKAPFIAKAAPLTDMFAGEEFSRNLLRRIAQLGTDSKARWLKIELDACVADGFDSIIVFTQYTDTMEYFRDYLADQMPGMPVACYSGAGGAWRDASGL